MGFAEISAFDLPRWGWGLLGGTLGLLIGSFLATVALRWPIGGSALSGRSRCDSCGRALAPVELVPLLSFLLLRGRCRDCRAPIDRRHPAIELLAAMIGAGAFLIAPGIGGAAGALFGWLLLLLALLDADLRILPDHLTGPLALLGLGAGALDLAPPLADRLLGLALGYASFQALRLGYRRLRGREGMGGGDPKLFGAVGAWLGWQPLPLVALAAAMLGLLVALVQAGRFGRPALAARYPLGTFLAAAGILVWALANAGALPM